MSDKINFAQPEERYLKPGSIELEDLDPNIFPFEAFTFTNPTATTGTVVLSMTENYKFINDPIDSMSDSDTLIIWDASTLRHRTATHLEVVPRTIYNAPATLTIIAGDDDNAASVAKCIKMHDGLFSQIEEVAATPGFDVEFGFTGIDADFVPTHVIVRYEYDGGTHDVGIDIWDYTNEDWDTFRRLNGAGLYTTDYFAIPDDISGDYISGGAMKLRFYHYSGGNASHHIEIDYVSLVHYAGRPPV